MALLDRISGGFSFDLGDLESAFSGVSADAPALDVDSLSGAAGPLGSLDLGPVTDAVNAVSGHGLAGLGELADPTGFLAPLTGVIEEAETFLASNPAELLTRLRERFDTGEGPPDLSDIAATLGGATGILEDDTLGAAARLAESLSGGALDLTGPIAGVTQKGEALTRILAATGGLMAVWSRVNHIAETGRRMAGLLPSGELNRLRAQLAAWFDNTDLADQIAAADPDDPEAVRAIGALVGEYIGALNAFHRLIQRGLGFGEAALTHADLPGALQRITDALQLLSDHQVPDPIREFSIALQTWIDERLPADWSGIDSPVETLTDRMAAEIAGLIAAVEDFDASAVTRPVSDAIGTVTGLVGEINQALDAVANAVQSGMGAVRDLVESLNLQRVAEAVRSAIRPISDAIERLDALLADSLAIIENAMTTATSAITTAKGKVESGAATLQSAFDTAASEIDTVLEKLPQVMANVEGGLNEVVEALQKIQLDPYFDAAIDVMDTAATAIDTVPLDILPDDVEADLQEAVQPVKAIDFDADVRQVLTDKLDEILVRLDTDILAEVDAKYQELIGFLQDNDPREPLAEFEAETFDPLLEAIAAIDPDEILRPVTEILDEAKAAVAQLDLRAAVLDDIDGAFDEILTHYDSLDPEPLLAPIADRVDAVRNDLKEVSKIDDWADHLDSVAAELTGLLDRIDLEKWIPKLEAEFDTVLLSLRAGSGAGGAAALGNILSALTGPGVRVSAFAEIHRWIGGENGAERVRALLAPAVEQLDGVRLVLDDLGLEDTVARASGWHRSLTAAVDAHDGTLLHQTLAPLLANHAPQTLFGPALSYGDRYAAALSDRIGELQSVAGSGFSQITTVSQALRDGLRPLAMVQQRFVDLLRRFGVDPANLSLMEIIAAVFAHLRPSDLLGPLEPLIAAVKTKLAEVVDTGLVAPVKEGIAELQALVDAIDIGIITDELKAVHTALRDQITALRPSGLLEEPLTAFEDLQATVADYDPLAPVRTVIDAFKDSVAVLESLRPTVLLESLIQTYERILDAAGDLNVRELLAPILEELAVIAERLDDGLERTGESFAGLQGVLP